MADAGNNGGPTLCLSLVMDYGGVHFAVIVITNSVNSLFRESFQQ